MNRYIHLKLTLLAVLITALICGVLNMAEAVDTRVKEIDSHAAIVHNKCEQHNGVLVRAQTGWVCISKDVIVDK